MHFDIYELNGYLIGEGKGYFSTFIHNHSKYTYVYLIRIKDEAFHKFKEYKSVSEIKKKK